MSRDAFSVSNTKRMTVIGFTHEDLELNKHGELSKAQIQNQKQKMDKNMKKTYKVIFSVWIIFLAIRVTEIILTNGKVKGNETNIILAFGAIFLLYCILALWGGYRMNKKNKKLLSAHPKIECLSGKVELLPPPQNIIFNPANKKTRKSFFRDLITTYTIKIAGENIHLDRETISAFEDGKNYNIYTVKLPLYHKVFTRLIVAAEQIKLAQA